MANQDPFGARQTIDTPRGERVIYRLEALRGIADLSRLPYSIRVLLESALRNIDGFVVTEEHVKAIANYNARSVGEVEIPFKPGRVVLQDFTGVPAVVDLAAMRDAMVEMTGDPSSASKVNPLVPCDLVIDHSVQVDAFGSDVALTINADHEFERNNERYEFLKWGQQAFDNFRVVPPATGIVHQVNLEYLAKVAWEAEDPQGGTVLFPDSLVGTDSHTTMINGLGVVGWGVGGIEAEAVMLGQPIYMLLPEVVGVKLTGVLKEGATATDLVLRVTQMLREHGVVGKFVEFHGPGLAKMPLANRATIANMAPEYGATMGFFPIDEQTLEYLRLSGRDEKLIETVEQYARTQMLWRDDSQSIVYSDDLELDLSTVEPALAGPKRPQDRIALSAMQSQWRQDLSATFGRAAAPVPGDSTPSEMAAEGGVVVAEPESTRAVETTYDGKTFELKDGAVVIAAITSCTNTSNPEVMLAAGLVAKKAVARGLQRKPWVKTSLAPGSKVVTDYYERAGLTGDLEALGFHTVGYGCTTCIGNSGPLPDEISAAIQSGDLIACSVLSGNRNFEGRVNPDVRANYLASPPLVVAYAIAGTVDIDLSSEPIGEDTKGHPVMLSEIWPTQAEIAAAVAENVTREQFVDQYADVFAGSQQWQDVKSSEGDRYAWDEDSTYVRQPPFFSGLSGEPGLIHAIEGARCLAKLGDSVTTDHISPAGAIKTGTPAAQYLDENGVARSMYNSYGSRRGNDRVMTRGTFANIRVRNQLAPGTEGGWTTDFTQRDTLIDQPGQAAYIYDAAMNYQASGTPLVVLAGNDYGMGSSRDWAAKGTFLLGVRAVIASSFERIHRSNLVGMGILPLVFEAGVTHEFLGLDGTETFSIAIDDNLEPRQKVVVTVTHPGGKTTSFETLCRIDTPVEIEYYRNGGILQTVLRNMA
ncbi:aconitate hydratase AcnA [Mucisphaera calidilacus]|uniref:Aconitate hydratase n=1 Tax=Mucisphaera calidilacus TaxID=2527982 RepID=A0A518BZT3_9BACT|nr:aconitate hydratase AcnA [Mucisphaera calidilacus]QDU72482.1 Aconitate hydratase precursor [Mucisphaera calidilacus]